jgi:pyrimidine operon attenuation protein/uracil phosphoribosyltransferase
VDAIKVLAKKSTNDFERKLEGLRARIIRVHKELNKKSILGVLTIGTYMVKKVIDHVQETIDDVLKRGKRAQNENKKEQMNLDE